jgi:hypothetical protein
LHWFVVAHGHLGCDSWYATQPQTVGHSIVKYGRQDTTMHDTVVALMIGLRDKFGVRHVLFEAKREVESYAVIFAANKAALTLVAVQRGFSSVRTHEALPWTKL